MYFFHIKSFFNMRSDCCNQVPNITKGDQDGVYGVTNALKIVEVGQVV